jgi:hypothetical protein
MEPESEDAFYLEAFELAVAGIEGLLANTAADERVWLRKFSKGLACLVDFLEGRPELGRLLFGELDAGGPMAQERWSETLKRAAQFIDLARDEPGAFSPSQITADAVVAGIYGVLRSELLGSVKPELRAAIPELTYYAVLPYFGPTVAQRETVAAREGRA